MFALKLLRNNSNKTTSVVGYAVKVETSSPLYTIVDDIGIEQDAFGANADEEKIEDIQSILSAIAQHTAPQIVTKRELCNMGQLAMLISGQSFKEDGFYLIITGDKTGLPYPQIIDTVNKLISTSDDSMWQRIDGDWDVAEECIERFCDKVLGPDNNMQVSFSKEEEQDILNDVRDLVDNAVQKKINKITEDRKADGLASDSPITYKLRSLSDVLNIPILRGCVVSDSYDRLYLTTPVILDDFLDRHNGPIVGEKVILTGHQVGKLRKAMNDNTKTVNISNGCRVEEGAVLLAKKLCGQIANEEYELEER